MGAYVFILKITLWCNGEGLLSIHLLARNEGNFRPI